MIAQNFFTNYYRNRLQSSFGDGIGWILPGAVRQRSARYSVSSEGRWFLQYLHAPEEMSSPFGAYINIGSKGSVLRVKPRLISRVLLPFVRTLFAFNSDGSTVWIRALSDKSSTLALNGNIYLGIFLSLRFCSLNN